MMGKPTEVAFDIEYPVVSHVTRSVWPLLPGAWVYNEPVDFGAEELVLGSNDGIVERLRKLEERGFDLDLSKVYGTGGREPAPAPVVLAALIAFLEDSFRAGVRVGIISD